MEQISYKLDIFEGPMDLLLHLISKHKLNINDIPIFELVEQYVSYVQKMQEENMEVASDFLEMAARLIYIKTVSLLPKHEEAEVLKKELTGELIEYRDCKIIAEKLSKQTDGFNYFTRKPAEIEIDRTYERVHDSIELLNAYVAAVGNGQKRLPPPVETFKKFVAKTIVSVSSRVNAIMRTLWGGKKVKFSSLFEKAASRSELVATFLAVLELSKDKKIHIDGEAENMTVKIIKQTETEAKEF